MSDARREVARTDWVRQRRLSLLRRAPWLEVFQDEYRLPGGKMVPDYFAIELPDYAVVAALTADGDLVAERQYRPGAGGISWTLPAGYIEAGEAPVAAARRELAEETGFTGGDWIDLGAYVVDGNRGCGRAHFFLAQGVRQTAPPQHLDLAAADVHLVPFVAFVERLRNGDVSELASATGAALAAINLTSASARGLRAARTSHSRRTTHGGADELGG